MALDTQDKRLSALNIGSPWRGMLPLPDGTLSQADRQHVMYLYRGILASTVVIVAGPYRYAALDAHELGAIALSTHAPGPARTMTHDPGAVATATL